MKGFEELLTLKGFYGFVVYWSFPEFTGRCCMPLAVMPIDGLSSAEAAFFSAGYKYRLEKNKFPFRKIKIERGLSVYRAYNPPALLDLHIAAVQLLQNYADPSRQMTIAPRDWSEEFYLKCYGTPRLYSGFLPEFTVSQVLIGRQQIYGTLVDVVFVECTKEGIVKRHVFA